MSAAVSPSSAVQPANIQDGESMHIDRETEGEDTRRLTKRKLDDVLGKLDDVFRVSTDSATRKKPRRCVVSLCTGDHGPTAFPGESR
jgi:hypothetical protein